MSIRRSLGLTMAAAILLAAPLGAQRRPPPEVPVTGRNLKLWTADGGMILGELISVEDERALLMTAGGHLEVDLGGVTRVQVERHNFTSRRTWTWVGIGALASGIGLAAACSSVEDADCAGVLPAVALSWTLVGGLLAVSLGRSAWEEVAAFQPRLRPFARFPQGAPPGYDRR